MRWSTDRSGNMDSTKLKRVLLLLGRRTKSFGKYLNTELRALVKAFMSKLSSGQNFTKRKNATPTGSYPQKQTTISSTKLKDSARVEMSGFKQLPRKMAFGRIFTAAKLKESIEETAGGIKHDMEANRTDIEEASNVTPAEITVKRSNLNELLAQRLRDEIGVDCQAPEIGSVEIEHKHYYSYNIPMSPKITTNRGCIIVSGRSFSLIQIIQRN